MMMMMMVIAWKWSMLHGNGWWSNHSSDEQEWIMIVWKCSLPLNLPLNSPCCFLTMFVAGASWHGLPDSFLKESAEKHSFSGKVREVPLVPQVVYSPCMKNDQYLQGFLNKAQQWVTVSACYLSQLLTQLFALQLSSFSLHLKSEQVIHWWVENRLLSTKSASFPAKAKIDDQPRVDKPCAKHFTAVSVCRITRMLLRSRNSRGSARLPVWTWCTPVNGLSSMIFAMLKSSRPWVLIPLKLGCLWSSPRFFLLWYQWRATIDTANIQELGVGPLAISRETTSSYMLLW